MSASEIGLVVLILGIGGLLLRLYRLQREIVEIYELLRKEEECLKWLSRNFHISEHQISAKSRYKTWEFRIPTEDGYNDLRLRILEAIENDRIDENENEEV